MSVHAPDHEIRFYKNLPDWIGECVRVSVIEQKADLAMDTLYPEVQVSGDVRLAVP